MNKLAKWFPFMFRRKKRPDDSRVNDGRTIPVHVQASQPTMPANRPFDPMMSERGWHDPLALFGEMDRFFGDFSPRAFLPSVDVVDEGKHVRLTAELPGLDRKDLDVTVHDGVLVLRGEKKAEDESTEDGCYRLERYVGQFQRAIPLPAEIDVDRAEAKFAKGLLTIRFPKTDDGASVRKIVVG